MIRVLRVLEYEYPDVETFESDMTNWSVCADGVFQTPARRIIIRSTVLPFSVVPNNQPESE